MKEGIEEEEEEDRGLDSKVKPGRDQIQSCHI